MKAETPAQEPSNAFTFLVAEQRDGECANEAAKALAEALEAVEMTGKAAKIVLTLTIETTKAGAVVVSDDIKTKLPEAEKGSSIFFPNEHGGLQRNDPKQRTFDEVLRVVGGGKIAESESTESESTAVSKAN